jgi:hypothetical protein
MARLGIDILRADWPAPPTRWRFKSRADDHAPTRAGPVSATSACSDEASRSKRRKVGSLLDADPGSRSDAD